MRITAASGVIVFLTALETLSDVAGSVQANFERLADIAAITHRADRVLVTLSTCAAYSIAVPGWSAC